MNDVRSKVSDEGWRQRVDLAACYRLVAHFGWDDLIFTHISGWVAGSERHFLIRIAPQIVDGATAMARDVTRAAERSPGRGCCASSIA